MAHTIETFAAKAHDILKPENNPAGRDKVRALLQEYLKDEAFVAKYLTGDTPERKILYEDPELGFCILAHYYRGAKDSPPHDHGPSWAIYGQARGETQMSDYELLEPATPEKPGKCRKVRTYKLTPGVAYVYNEHDLHSPSRAGPTRLIRIEGTNVDKIKRLKLKVMGRGERRFKSPSATDCRVPAEMVRSDLSNAAWRPSTYLRVPPSRARGIRDLTPKRDRVA